MEKEKFRILMPPFNANGSMHIGHALNLFICDMIARKEKIINNKNAFIIPGLDHGGISTQISSKVDPNDPDAFKKIEDFSILCEKKLIEQIKSLDLSIDWSLYDHTFGHKHTKLVHDTFDKLKKENLIYQAKKIINFDTKLKTPVSNLEVSYRLEKKEMYEIYYIIDEQEYAIHTTKPETIFGDTALAFHPNDERYIHLKGKMAHIDYVGKKIPVIASELVDPNFGTGLLKVTPAHDKLDYEIGQLNNLEIIDIYDENGNNLYNKEDILKNIKYKSWEYESESPYNEKTNAPIIYKLEKNYFLKTQDAAKEILKELPIIKPSKWINNYKTWLENIEDWCISRSNIWGHTINSGFNKLYLYIIFYILVIKFLSSSLLELSNNLYKVINGITYSFPYPISLKFLDILKNNSFFLSTFAFLGLTIINRLPKSVDLDLPKWETLISASMGLLFAYITKTSYIFFISFAICFMFIKKLNEIKFLEKIKNKEIASIGFIFIFGGLCSLISLNDTTYYTLAIKMNPGIAKENLVIPLYLIFYSVITISSYLLNTLNTLKLPILILSAIISNICFYFSHNFLILCLSMCFNGIFVAGVKTIVPYLVSRYAAKEELKGTIFGIYYFVDGMVTILSVSIFTLISNGALEINYPYIGIYNIIGSIVLSIFTFIFYKKFI